MLLCAAVALYSWRAQKAALCLWIKSMHGVLHRGNVPPPSGSRNSPGARIPLSPEVEAQQMQGLLAQVLNIQSKLL